MLRVVIPTNINQSAVPHPLLDHCISQPVCRWLTDWRWINRSEQHQEPPFQAEQSSPLCPAPLFGCAVTLQTKWTIWKYKLNLVTVSPVTHCLENSELGLYLALFIRNKVSIKIILNADFFVNLTAGGTGTYCYLINKNLYFERCWTEVRPCDCVQYKVCGTELSLKPSILIAHDSRLYCSFSSGLLQYTSLRSSWTWTLVLVKQPIEYSTRGELNKQQSIIRFVMLISHRAESSVSWHKQTTVVYYTVNWRLRRNRQGLKLGFRPKWITLVRKMKTHQQINSPGKMNWFKKGFTRGSWVSLRSETKGSDFYSSKEQTGWKRIKSHMGWKMSGVVGGFSATETHAGNY